MEHGCQRETERIGAAAETIAHDPQNSAADHRSDVQGRHELADRVWRVEADLAQIVVTQPLNAWNAKKFSRHNQRQSRP